MTAFLIVRAEVDPSVRDAFDTWYRDEHLPDSGCVKARINGEQRIPHPAVCGAGDDSERWVGI